METISQILKSHDLKLTSDSFFLSPYTEEGEQFIMADAPEALEAAREIFKDKGLGFDQLEPVDHALNSAGQHYILSIEKGGSLFDLPEYWLIHSRKCESPAKAKKGIFNLREYAWNELD